MLDLHSEHDRWSLRDAIMRTSDPMLLASLAQKRLELGRQPWWWVPSLAPDPLLKRRIEYRIDPEQDYELTVKALETAFRIKLVKGELVCWAQPTTTNGAYSKLNSSAWWALMVDDWWGGTLIEATRDEHRDFVPVAGGARYYGAIIQTPCVGSASDNSQHDSEVPPKRTWMGFDDGALVEEMKQLVDDDRVQSAWEAACAVAPRAKGGGTTESKAKRLHRKYSRT